MASSRTPIGPNPNAERGGRAAQRGVASEPARSTRFLPARFARYSAASAAAISDCLVRGGVRQRRHAEAGRDAHVPLAVQSR